MRSALGEHAAQVPAGIGGVDHGDLFGGSLGDHATSGLTFALSRIVRASGGAGGVYDPDWPSFVVPVAIVAAIGAAATWIPSRRALQINPAVVLRDS